MSSGSRWRRSVEQEAGFTLIEVLVVVAVIAILAGAATLSFAAFAPSLRIRQAGQELHLQIQKARLEAIRRSRPCYVEFHRTVDGVRYAPLIWLDENRDGIYQSGEAVFRQQVNPENLELAGFRGVRFDTARGGGDGVAFAAGATSAENVFRFNSRGLSDKAGAIHLVNSAGQGRILDVTLGGAVRIR